MKGTQPWAHTPRDPQLRLIVEVIRRAFKDAGMMDHSTPYCYRDSAILFIEDHELTQAYLTWMEMGGGRRTLSNPARRYNRGAYLVGEHAAHAR